MRKGFAETGFKELKLGCKAYPGHPYGGQWSLKAEHGFPGLRP